MAWMSKAGLGGAWLGLVRHGKENDRLGWAVSGEACRSVVRSGKDNERKCMLHIDLETRSPVNLPKVGIDVYFEHPDTDVLCAAWCIGDGPIELWLPSMTCPDAIKNYTGTIHAHNAAFELTAWEKILAPRYGWPPMQLERFRCSMAAAYSMSLPGSLENAAIALGLDAKKDAEGRRIMLQLSQPRTLDPLTWWEDLEKLERLYEYCMQDTRVERELSNKLVTLSDAEQALWCLDMRINRRGIHFDREAVVAAQAMADSEKKRLDGEMQHLTNGYVGSCGAHASLVEWIQLHGVKIDGVAKPDVLDALSGDLPAPVRAALLLRQEAAKSSVAKLRSMLNAASADDRIRHMLQYHGAATGRWAGRRVQLHNLPRPTLAQPYIEACIHLIKAGKRDDIELFYGRPLDVIASCLRGMLDAAPGKVLMAVDFSNIEGRVLAWLAGEEWKLDAFRAYDRGEGPDIYKLAYSRSFNVPAESVTKDERQVGKVQELALGYQGWVGAFQTMAKGSNVVISDERAAEIAGAWRTAHPATRKYWGELEAAAIMAVRNPDVPQRVGPDGRASTFLRVGNFLWLHLPSGRCLCYPYPEVILKTRTFTKEDGSTYTKSNDALQYVGQSSITNKWGPVDTYGGSLAENITQAVSRDILAEALVRVGAIYDDIVLHVHDEVVIELDGTEIPEVLEHFENLVAESPTWAAGLPIAAEGWRGKRYRK